MSRTPYPSSLTDAQWRLIEPLVPPPRPGGRPAKYTRRAIVDGILYVARTGCAWRSLPTDLPTYRICFHYSGGGSGTVRSPASTPPCGRRSGGRPGSGGGRPPASWTARR
ncbi:MAG: transposase [Gemmataceae bacterium]